MLVRAVHAIAALLVRTAAQRVRVEAAELVGLHRSEVGDHLLLRVRLRPGEQGYTKGVTVSTPKV